MQKLRRSFRRRRPEVVWVWLGLLTVATIEAVAVQQDGTYGAIFIIVFDAVYMLLFFLGFRAIWWITVVLNGLSLLIALMQALGGLHYRGTPEQGAFDVILHLTSLILLATPDMRAFFFDHEPTRIPERPDVPASARRKRWDLRSLSVPFMWDRPIHEHPELVRNEGVTTLIYASPEFKRRFGYVFALALAGLAIQFVLIPLLVTRIFASATFLFFAWLFLRVAPRLRGPVLTLDDVGLKDLIRQHRPYLVLWPEVTGLEIKRSNGSRVLSIAVSDPDQVLARQGGSRFVRWAYRQNRRQGLSVMVVRESHLPITLEGLTRMIRERIDGSRPDV